ncbi:MAG: O-antigen ligase family protein [Alphaproteobacteria bacterium]|nr:O-antigen ligase family protein [Alphaproteobacteria bacterium]
MHLLLIVPLALVLALPSSALERASGIWLAIATAGVLAIPSAIGLLPVPAFLGRLLQPGWAFERGDVSWGFLSLDPDVTVGSILAGTAGLAVLVCTSALAYARKWRAPPDLMVAGFAITLIALAALHVGMGNKLFLGRIPVDIGNRPFFAPFLDVNHFGGALALWFPLVVGAGLAPDTEPSARFAWGGLGTAMIAMAVWAGSLGPLAVIAVELAVLLAWYRLRIGLLLAPVAAVGVLVVLARDAATDSLWDLHGRWSIWLDSVRLFGAHWATGSGLGTFGDAIEPYRSDRRFETWSHAHNDWIEWGADTGLVGVVAMIAVVAMWAPALWSGLRHSRTRPLVVAALGLLLFGSIDFPLHIPFLALALAFLLGFLALRGVERRVPVLLVRGFVAALVVLQLAGAAWEARAAAIRGAIQTLASSAEGRRDAVAMLERLSPGHFEVSLASLNSVVAPTVCPDLEVRHRREPRVFRACAAALLEGDPMAAMEAAEWAVRLAPADWRHWVLRARAVSAADPDRTLQVWLDAISAYPEGALHAGWEQIPVGLYWVDAVSDQPRGIQIDVANFVMAKGDVDAALLGFEAAGVTDDPSFSKGYMSALIASGRLDEALQIYRTTAHPDDAAAARLARALEKAGRHSEAAEIWLEHPKSRDSRFRAARALYRAGDGPQAMGLLLRARTGGEMLSDQETFLLADLLVDAGRVEDCVSTLAAAAAVANPKRRKDVERRMDRCRRGP